ncbi:MAG: hypothetical protein QXH07_01785 [Thermoplasmata archaeon]
MAVNYITGAKYAITITNNTGYNTPTNFAQRITLSPATVQKMFINSDLSNLQFTSDAAGTTVLNSWRESGTSPNGSITFYVLLPSVLNNGSSTTIYLQSRGIGQNVLNTTNTGVAPQLTSTYAQYDNGSTVFPNAYYRFGGLSGGKLPSGWTINNTATITNNATNTTFGSGGDGYPNYVAYSGTATGTAIEMYGVISDTASTPILFGYNDGTNNSSFSIAFGLNTTSSTADYGCFTGGNQSTAAWTCSYAQDTKNHVFTASYDSTTSGHIFVDYGYGGSGSLTTYTTDYIIITPDTNGSTATMTIYWLRVRPNIVGDAMPTTSVAFLY